MYAVLCCAVLSLYKARMHLKGSRNSISTLFTHPCADGRLRCLRTRTPAGGERSRPSPREGRRQIHSASRPPGLFLWAWPLTQAIPEPAEWPTCHPAGHATPYLHTISAAARQITPKVRGLPHACNPVRGEDSLVSGRAV